MWQRPLTRVVAVAFAAYYAWTFCPVAASHVVKSEGGRRDHQAAAALVRSLRERYVRHHPQAVFFNWGGRFPLFLISPLDNYRELRELKMLGLGWGTHSPLFDAAMSRLDLGDLYRATYTNPNLYLLTGHEQLRGLERFVEEHDRQSITIKHADHLLTDSDALLGYFAGDFGIYQMRLAGQGEDEQRQPKGPDGAHSSTKPPAD